MKLITKLHHTTTRISIKLILLLLVTGVENIVAQARKMPVSVNFNIKVDTTKVRVYTQHCPDESESVKTIILNMKYGESEILNPEAAKDLEEVGCNVISVDLVYTDYQKQDVQDLLNRKRLTELYFICPNAFTQSMTQWRYVEQLGYASEEQAKKLWHGLVVKYVQMPVYKPASAQSMLSLIKTKGSKDTSFYRLFSKQIKFKDELICVDLTGSMSPYYMQVMQWLCMKNNPKKIGFSFFNDGNATPDHLKRMGSVGGIYSFKTNSIDTIAKNAYRCTSSGCGGDSPENNIESILKGLERFPESKEIIMLADNWADMRDYSMLSKVKIPVKIIICGTNYNGIKSPVNPQYLDLARKTGGSVHTMEEDLEDLAKKKEGEELVGGGLSYIIRGGKFVRK